MKKEFHIKFLIAVFLFISQDVGADLTDDLKNWYKSRDFLQSSHESYDFIPCKDLNSNSSFKYYVKPCKEMTIDRNIRNLYEDFFALTTDQLEDSFLTYLEDCIQKELENDSESLERLKLCFGEENNYFSDYTCEESKEAILSSVRRDLPKLRLLMSQMNMAGKIYSPTKPDRFKKTDLKHPATQKRVKSLSDNEIEFLQSHTYQLEHSFEQKIYKDNNISGLNKCLDKTNPDLISLKKDSSCKRFKVIVGLRVNNLFEDQNKKYQQEYHNLVASNRILSLLDLRGDENDDEIFVSVAATLSALNNEVEKTIGYIGNLDDDDRVELLGLKRGVEVCIEKSETTEGKQARCDIATNIKSRLSLDELTTDLAIAGAGILGGLFCTSTFGIGCLVGASISIEFLALGITHFRLEKSKALFYSGIGSSKDIVDRRFEQKAGAFLAPLAIVGGKQFKYLVGVTEKVVSPSKIKTSKTGLRRLAARTGNLNPDSEVTIPDIDLKEFIDKLGKLKFASSVRSRIIKATESMNLKEKSIFMYRIRDAVNSRKIAKCK